MGQRLWPMDHVGWTHEAHVRKINNVETNGDQIQIVETHFGQITITQLIAESPGETHEARPTRPDP